MIGVNADRKIDGQQYFRRKTEFDSPAALLYHGHVRSPFERTPPKLVPLVLVVDDEGVVLTYLANALRIRGYNYVLAEDGESGLVMFREFRDEIRLVVTDVAMPRMSGPDMVREIRKLDSAVPIMFITGFSPGFVIPLEFQACAALKKPFTVTVFLDLVEHCLDSKKLD